jgi:thioesterase domain-containing protein
MLDSIEAMASDYLPVVRSIQPRGPYRLGGFCDGGFVAYEITTSLLAQGERVEHLILINTPAPSARIAWIDGAIRLVGRQRRLWPEFRRRFAQILALRLRRVISAFSQGPSSCLRALRDQIELVSARPIDFHGDPATSELEVALGVVEHTYHPRPCASPLTLMWGEEEYRPILHDDTMGWGALVRSVTVIPIPGDHLSGIRRACALIAERLRYEFSRDTHHIEACDKISVS